MGEGGRQPWRHLHLKASIRGPECQLNTDNTTHAKVADTGFELVLSGAMMAVLGRMSFINDLLSLTISVVMVLGCLLTLEALDDLHPDLVKYLLRIHVHLPVCLCACVPVCVCIAALGLTLRDVNKVSII